MKGEMVNSNQKNSELIDVQIERLKNLQEVDSSIYALKKKLQEEPRRIEDLDKEFESKKARLEQLKNELKTLQTEHGKKELDLQTAEGNIAKREAQLYSLKSNKEYTAALKEIRGLKADKSLVEDRILSSLEGIDRARKAIEQENAFLVQGEQEYKIEKQNIQQQIQRLKDELAQYESKRKTVVVGIDADKLELYNRVLEKKSGLAIVPVKGSSCGGCYIQLRPQIINEIKLRKDLVTCETCSRILYVEE